MRKILILAAASITFGATAAAAAPCTQWGVGGKWHAVQSNGFDTLLEMKRTGTALSGMASYDRRNQGGSAWSGSINGSSSGDSIEFTVTWNGGDVAVYKGNFDAKGKIVGTTYRQRNPRDRAQWYSSVRMNCVS